MRVLVRVRPPLQPAGTSASSCVELLPREGAVRLRHGGARRAHGEPVGALRADFDFSCALGGNATQEDVWESVRGPIDQALHESANACVLAYGQTGSGKTHTMLGPGSYRDRGVIQRALGLVFATADAARAATSAPRVVVTVSFAEVYAEGVYDLLGGVPARAVAALASPDATGVADTITSCAHGAHSTPPPRVDVRGGGLRALTVGTEAAALSLLLVGVAARATSATQMNAASSRSHAVFIVTIQANGRESRIFLVDLAGSERVFRGVGGGATAAAHDREGAAINLSLHCLELVMIALAERQAADRGRAGDACLGGGGALPVQRFSADRLMGSSANSESSISASSSGDPSTAASRGASAVHVPYRNSALTALLREALGSACWPVLVACVSPELHFSDETASTCRFAARCALVDAVTTPDDDASSGAASREGGVGSQMLRARVRELEAELETLRARASAFGIGSKGVTTLRNYAAPDDAVSIEDAVISFLSNPGVPASESLPLADWALPQIAHAFETLRSAVVSAVSAAGAASADTDAAKGRAVAAEEALSCLRKAVREVL